MRYLIAFVLTAVLSLPATAQDSLNVSLVGSLYHHWDYACDVEIVGDYAYVATGESGMSILDVSDPVNLQEVGFFGTAGFVNGITVSGTCAYVSLYTGPQTDSGDHLSIVDISDPSAPEEIGRFCAGQAAKVALEGNYAYVAGGHEGLRIFDVSDPATPSEIGFYNPWGGVYSVAVAGNYAYLSSFGYSLRVVDISDPTTPEEVGSWDIPGHAYDVAISGDYAYIAESECGLRVIEVSDPTDPNEVGFLDMQGCAFSVAVENDIAFIIDWENGLRLIDVSEPSSPVQICLYEMSDLPDDFWYRILNVSAIGNDLYLPSGIHGLRILDISNPAVPEEVGQYVDARRVLDVVYADGYAYITEGAGLGLTVVSVDNPASPEEIGFCSLSGDASFIALAEDYAYVTIDSAGVSVIDISDPTSPTEVGFCNTPETSLAIAVDNGYVYLAEGIGGGLRVIDVSDPVTPLEIGYCDSVWASDICAADGYAYVGGNSLWGGGLHIFDVSDPSVPVEVGYCDTNAGFIAVDGDFAYVVGFLNRVDYGISVIDISDPLNPLSMGYTTLPYPSSDDPLLDGTNISAEYVDGYVLVANSWTGVYVIDVSDPTAPEDVGFYDTPGDARGIAGNSNYAFVADTYYFHVLDCSDAFVSPLIDIDLYTDLYGLWQGGSFTYDAVITSHLPAPYRVDFWTYVHLPDGTPYGPIWRINNFPFTPGTVINAEAIGQSVPIEAPPGWYTFHMRTGIFPYIVAGEDQFDFLVYEVDGEPSGNHSDWTGWEYETAFGDDFSSEAGNPQPPEHYSLSRAYPNPFNASTSLTVTLPERSELNVTVYNITGQLVKTLMNGSVNAGHYRMTFDATGLSGGVYFVKASANNWEAVQKMVLLK